MGHGVEQAGPLLVGLERHGLREVGDGGAERRDQLGQGGPAAGEVGTQLVGRGGQDERLNGLDDRSVRHALPLVAAPPQHEGSFALELIFARPSLDPE